MALRKILVPLLLVLASFAAHADTTVEKAKERYARGKLLQEAGAYDDAIREYIAANDLAPRPELYYNIAQCYRLKGEAKPALSFYRLYLERAPQGSRAGVASAHIADLERQLAAATPPPVVPARDHAAPRPGRGLKLAGLVSAGVGVGALAAGTAFALSARAAADDVSGLAPGATWDPARYDEGRAAQRNMIICYAAGGAAVAGGVVLYLLGHRADARAGVRVDASATSATLSLGGAF